MKKPGIRLLGYSDPRGFEYAVVDLDLLVPDPENPRLPVQESTLDSILALQAQDPDGLFALAKDIVALAGTSPSELLNVSRVGAAFVVREGNRRIAARRILRNPEILRGHVSKAELDRWARLGGQSDAKRLAGELLVVIGEDHDVWVDRRHLGPQSGIGVQQWRPEAKARREERSRGTKDRTLSLLDALVASHPARFEKLRPPERTFTTFERVLESSTAAAHIGIDVDEDGNVRLTKGERSLRLLEEVLGDLRKAGSEKLTSRKIHDTDAILLYLDEVDGRLNEDLDEDPVSLVSEVVATTAKVGKKNGGAVARKKDLLTQFSKPTAARPARLYEELKKLRKDSLPNAAIIVTRVFLEITADHYATENSLAFAGDRNVQIEEEVKDFEKQLSVANIKPSKTIRQALDFAARKPISLGKKLELAIRDLVEKKRLDPKEGPAKIRELNEKKIVELLNDAVHRLENVPNMERVDHILEVVRPIYNAMVTG